MHDKKNLRSFGFIWAGILTAIALYPLTKEKEILETPLYIALLFCLISLVQPDLYIKTKFYQGWICFGNFMGKINSKIIITILFFGIFTPIGLILKIFRKDLLNKKLDPKADSYFIDRTEQPGSMSNQF